jgi:hypothetical protein
VPNLDPIKKFDQEFRTKTSLFENHTNVFELPQARNIKSEFQYFTNNFFEEVNPIILQFLEFRGKTFFIKNFDIMNFTRTVMN